MMTYDTEYGSKCLTNAPGNFLGCKIDQNLTVTQGIMGFINTVDTVDDPILERQVDKAKWFAGLGSAGPGVVAGTMMIVYRIAIALFVGFAPLFILSLLFKKTAPLFQKWLDYGLATVFSGVMLGVMSEIAMDLITTITVSSGALSLISSILTGNGTTGIMQTVTQQLGLGLILSTLLIVVPPMAGMWFHGVMGSYSGWNAMAGWGGAAQTPPPGIGGAAGYRQQVESRVAEARQNMAGATVASNQSGSSYNQLPIHIPVTNSSHAKNSSTDVIRAESQMGNAIQPIANSSNSDKTKTDKGEKI